ARAARDQAALNLSYTRITAPSEGVVSKKSVEIGQLVQPGQPLMSEVPLSDVWVTANLKETQTANVTPGDPADFTVDAYPGRHVKGHVESLSPATGAKFSLLPPDNATGNFTKVVQRIPVRIRPDAQNDATHPLRPGMSVVLTITGWLSAYFGRRRYFAGSIAIFVISSFFCGNAHSLIALVFWRIIQGLGGGALLSTSQAILYEVFPREEFGTAMAIFGVGVMVGPTLGPTLGGYITDAFGWPWIFYINIPIGMLALALSLSFIQNSRFQEKAERVDYVGL